MNKRFENPLVAFSLIWALTCLVYFNSLQAPFHFDDISSIISKPSVHLKHLSLTSLKRVIDSNRPVTDLSFAMNYYFRDLNASGYHLVNMAVHALTGCTVYLLILSVLGRSSAFSALLGSVVWVVHPVHTQAVTYVVQRATSLSTLFYLMTLLIYVWSRSWTGWRRLLAYLGLLACTILAMSSKETAATIPVVIVLYEFYFGSNFDLRVFKSAFMEALPLLVGVTMGLLLYIWIILWPAQGSLLHLTEVFTRNYAIEYYPMWERLLTELRVVVFYFSLLLLPLPSRLNIDHDFPLSVSLFTPPSTFFSFLVILGLMMFAIRAAKIYPIISFGIFWFFITTAMESFVLRLDLIFEHRLYLPSIGFILIVSFLLQKGLESRKLFSYKLPLVALVSLCAVTIGLLSLWTIQRNRVWQDPVSLWKDAIEKSPSSARANNNLGMIYMSRDQLDLAVQCFQEAVRLNPRFALYYENLSNGYERQGRLDLALGLFEKFIQQNPGNALGYYHLGRIYELQGKLERAKEALATSIRMEPRRARAYSLLGSTLVGLGELK